MEEMEATMELTIDSPRKEGEGSALIVTTLIILKTSASSLLGTQIGSQKKEEKTREFYAHAITSDDEEDQTHRENEKKLNHNEFSQQQLSLIAQKMLKMMKGKNVAETPLSYTVVAASEDFTAFVGFSSMTETQNSESMEWIIDTRPTSHLSSKLNYFSSVKPLNTYHVVILLDGTKQRVSHSRDVRMTNKIVLKNVLHVQNFKFNLLSVKAT